LWRLVYTLYSNLFFDFEQTHHWCAALKPAWNWPRCSPPTPCLLSTAQAFLVEVIITAILMGVIMALTDDNNGLPRGPLAPC
jgi:glycerol uptake facilitator protein